MKLYSTKEFADLSGVSVRTLKRWRNFGKLKPILTNNKGENFYSKKQLTELKKIFYQQNEKNELSPVTDSFLGVTDLKSPVITPQKIQSCHPLGDRFLEKLPRADTQNYKISSENVNNLTTEVKNDDLQTYYNLQIYPSKKLVIAIDKMKQYIFKTGKPTLTPIIIEDKKTNTETDLTVTLSDEFKEEKKLSAYDELILDICVSEQFAGNEYTTPAIIHRAMGGSKTKITAKDKEKIMWSVRKLATTYIDFDFTDTCKRFGYNNGEGYKYSGYLLPAEYITKTINGQVDSAVIHFLRDSPLLDVARMKNQFITCDVALLDVQNIRNTELVLKLKGYLLRRVLQIVGSRKPHKKHFAGKKKDGKPIHRQANKLADKILLDTIFEQCEISDADKWKKQDARNIISKIMNHFKEEGLISEWRFETKYGKFHAVKIEC